MGHRHLTLQTEGSAETDASSTNKPTDQPTTQPENLFPETLFPALRTGTQAAHQQVETLTCMQRLFMADYSLAEYLRLLRQLYGLYAPLEEAILSLSQQNPLPWGYGLKHPLIEQDLHCMDNPLSAGPAERLDLTALPVASTSDRNTISDAQLVGAMYVLQGATLGGSRIASHLEKHFASATAGEHTTVQPSFLFYRAGGEQPRATWMAFQSAVLAQLHASQQDPNKAHNPALFEQVALETANAVFGCFYQWMSRI
ncbi:MAG: biliverdin-producing heme oxygenase [Candidatus Melainabacteria bacterium]|nr:biliverdin-producing heme oxygenase [Candidatus Melainabacteria bacterium]